MATISLASNHALTMQGSGETTWGIDLSDVSSKIKSANTNLARIKKITLNFSGTAYNNAILGAKNEYAICGLASSDGDIVTNTSGGTGGTNLFKYGPFEIGAKKTVNMQSQSIDITKYFNVLSPHSVQNTSYTRLSVAFTSKATYKKTYTFSLSLDIEYEPLYTITLNANGGSCSVGSYTRYNGDYYGTITSGSSNPTKTGHSFSHWATEDGTRIYAASIVTGDITLYAQYTPNNYEIATDITPAGTGSVTGGGTYAYGTTATLTAKPNTGYKFAKWREDNSTTNPRTITVSQYAYFTAVFEKLSYTVTFKNWDGTVLKTQSVLYQEAATPPANPTRPYDSSYHYTFSSWDKSYNNITGNTTVTAVYTGTAHSYSSPVTTNGGRRFTCSCGYTYEERAYDVSYDNIFSLADWIHSESSTVDRGSVTYNIYQGTITTTSFTQAEGEAWIAGGSNRTESQATDCYTRYNIASGFYRMPVSGGVEYNIEFEASNSGQCYVFYYTATGSCSPAHLNIGAAQGSNKKSFTTPADCVALQVRFGSTSEYNKTVTFSNITIYKKSSTIDAIIDRQYRTTFFKGESVSLYTPSKDGYVFDGWFTGENGSGTKLTSPYTPSSGITVYSKWLKAYIITTVAEPPAGGTIIGAGSYPVGASVTLTASASDEYVFRNWNDAVTTSSKTIIVTGDATYTAYFRFNTIYADTPQSFIVYADETEASEIYADTSKVYG